jgi:hypothetical protein
MKLTRFAFVLPLMLPATSWAAGASPQAVQATLTLPRDSVLPGVPFDMTVTMKNVSQSSVSVGISARLIVTLADGTKISPKERHILDPQVSAHPDTWIQLSRGESRQWTIDWHQFTPSMFHYPEFSGPGVYDVALNLAANKLEAPEDYVGAIETSVARLTRAVSPGEDEVLWKKMVTITSGRWTDDSLANSKDGRQILREILQIHPASAYYPYALLLEPQFDHRPVTKDDIAKALDAAARFPDSPAYPHLLLRAGDIAANIASHAWWDHDSKTTLEYFAIAENYYDDALKKAPSLSIRSSAERGKQFARDELARERLRAAGAYKN